jgi:hypothetical protein
VFINPKQLAFADQGTGSGDAGIIGDMLKPAMCKKCQITILSCGGGHAALALTILARHTGCTVRATQHEFRRTNRGNEITDALNKWILKKGDDILTDAESAKGFIDFNPDGGTTVPTLDTTRSP